MKKPPPWLFKAAHKAKTHKTYTFSKENTCRVVLPFVRNIPARCFVCWIWTTIATAIKFKKKGKICASLFHVFLNTSYLIRYVDTHIEQSLCSQYNEQHIGPARFASLNVTATCVVEMVVMVTSGHENTARPHGWFKIWPKMVSTSHKICLWNGPWCLILKNTRQLFWPHPRNNSVSTVFSSEHNRQ